MTLGRTGLAALVVTLVLGAQAHAGEVAPTDVQIVDGAAAVSLTGAPGDPEAGAEVFANRKLGNCLACHANTDMSDQAFHGEVGPALDGVGSRWGEAELRAILVNSKEVFGDETIMPGFYRTSGLSRVAEKFAGKPILSGQQVEDVLAYLMTLKDE